MFRQTCHIYLPGGLRHKPLSIDRTQATEIPRLLSRRTGGCERPQCGYSVDHLWSNNSTLKSCSSVSLRADVKKCLCGNSFLLVYAWIPGIVLSTACSAGGKRIESPVNDVYFATFFSSASTQVVEFIVHAYVEIEVRRLFLRFPSNLK
jgi:hypothetical protein